MPRKQDKLNVFLQENLDSSCICPSKSLMASPVFFIKKKDSSLQLVQDYILNAMTVKNHDPTFQPPLKVTGPDITIRFLDLELSSITMEVHLPHNKPKYLREFISDRV
ncbi:hypothetical protein J132_00229 [Termitomyces sp. J132]|nr:hypothetical protein J132_00229 [Termitomyces sp. J132]